MDATRVEVERNAVAVRNCGAVSVCVLRSWADIDLIRKEWDELLLDGTNPSVFLSPEWQKSWFSAYHGLGELFVLAVTSESQGLIGLLPMYRASASKPFGMLRPIRVLRVVGSGSGGTSTNLGVVSRLEDCDEVARALADYLHANSREWDEIDLHFCLGEDPATQRFVGAMRRGGCTDNVLIEPHRIVSLAPTYTEYLASLSKKMRTEVPYEERRLERAYEVSFHRAENHAERIASTQTLIELNDKRWQARGEPGSFSTPEKRALAESVGARFLDLGWLDLWELRLDGRAAAIEYGFRFGDTFFPLWVAIDTDFIKFEVGSVLRAHIINHLIGLGIVNYEFMRGRETYKLRWGATEKEYYSTTLSKPRSYLSRVRRAESIRITAEHRSRSAVLAGVARIKPHVPEKYWTTVRDESRKLVRRG